MRVVSNVFRNCHFQVRDYIFLSIKFSNLGEYAGLHEDGLPQVLEGTLFSIDGVEKVGSRVSASFESDSEFFVRNSLWFK